MKLTPLIPKIHISEESLDEMGKNDAISQAIVDRYIKGNMTDQKMIAKFLLNRPYAKPDEIRDALLTIGRDEVFELADKLKLL